MRIRYRGFVVQFVQWCKGIKTIIVKSYLNNVAHAKVKICYKKGKQLNAIHFQKNCNETIFNEAFQTSGN